MRRRTSSSFRNADELMVPPYVAIHRRGQCRVATAWRDRYQAIVINRSDMGNGSVPPGISLPREGAAGASGLCRLANFPHGLMSRVPPALQAPAIVLGNLIATTPRWRWDLRCRERAAADRGVGPRLPGSGECRSRRLERRWLEFRAKLAAFVSMLIRVTVRERRVAT